MKSLSLLLLAGMMGMAGCGRQNAPLVTPATESDTWSDLHFYLRYTTVLNNDTAAISRCTSEELRTGNDHGPICKAACDTGEILIKFEQDNAGLMAHTNSKPSKQHEWCRKEKP